MSVHPGFGGQFIPTALDKLSTEEEINKSGRELI